MNGILTSETSRLHVAMDQLAFGARLKWLLDEQELLVLPCYLHVSICEVGALLNYHSRCFFLNCILLLPGWSISLNIWSRHETLLKHYQFPVYEEKQIDSVTISGFAIRLGLHVGEKEKKKKEKRTNLKDSLWRNIDSLLMCSLLQSLSGTREVSSFTFTPPEPVVHKHDLRVDCIELCCVQRIDSW